MKRRKQTTAFTLIELVMVIVILAILAAVAFPRFFNLADRANNSAEMGVVGGVRAGIQTYMANDVNNKWPTALDGVGDGTTCSTAAAERCFTNVLAQGGITSGWTKTNNTQYVGPTTTVYTYNVSTGQFANTN